MILNDINNKCEEEKNKNYDHLDLNNFNIICDKLQNNISLCLVIYCIEYIKFKLKFKLKLILKNLSKRKVINIKHY